MLAPDTIRPVAIPAIALILVLFTPAAAADHPDDASLNLVAVDEQTGEPIFGATVAGPPLERDALTEEDGRARLDGLEPGPAKLTVEFPGYDPVERVVALEPGETTEIRVELPPESEPADTDEATDDSEQLDEVQVTTTARFAGADIYEPDTTMEGEELQRNLDSSVPATLDAVPGFDVQYNGPGAANPTMRGLPGDRVLMLEDGHRTGDLYWTASDHGVMVEPLTAHRMEVIRGPASLLYGSNALGGVVNVVRNDVPLFQPQSVEGQARTTFDSVNRGLGAGGVVRAPAGPLAVYGEASARRTGETRTPAGPLEQTSMSTINAATGASWTPEWGRIGAAARFYDNTYGVPGEFDGQLIPGGHPAGVDIEARRIGSRLEFVHNQMPGLVDELEIKSQYTRYIHDELEGVLDGDDVLGARFDQSMTDTRIVAHHEPIGDEDSIHARGSAGVSLYTRDMFSGGPSPGTRSGRERDVGVFGFEQLDVEPFRLQTGLRYDHRSVTSTDLSPLTIETRQRRIAKDVEPRSFNSISGAVAGHWDFADDWTAGLGLARSVRNPTIEELYSGGPHLADFSYDIGEPGLDAEVGHGIDLFLKSDHSDLDLELGAYYNRIDNYIYDMPTGETVRVHREGERPRDTPVFEARGEDALFVGAEGRIQWNPASFLVLDLDASYTRASLIEDGDPLPFIPPLSGGIQARWDGHPVFGSVGVEFGGPQFRVPGPVEVGDTAEHPRNSTRGYTWGTATAGWRYDTINYAHTVMLEVRNVTDRLWHDHLSRIKEVAPQPGRNIQLSYELLF